MLQALFEEGRLRPGTRGLGFGCGEEPIASYLASKGLPITVTNHDPARARGLGWMETAQHTSAVEQAFKPELVGRDRFDELVRLEYVDMNDVPSKLHGEYDFCWSICALEHLGSIEKGMRFVENAMATLKPGGLAVYTTEFNYLSDDATLDEPPTVLFLRRHFVLLRERLVRAGHQVAALDFDTGDGPLNRFIDLPPYEWDALGKRAFGAEVGRLKLAVGRFPSTCFGIVVKARPVVEPVTGATLGGADERSRTGQPLRQDRGPPPRRGRVGGLRGASSPRRLRRARAALRLLWGRPVRRGRHQGNDRAGLVPRESCPGRPGVDEPGRLPGNGPPERRDREGPFLVLRRLGRRHEPLLPRRLSPHRVDRALVAPPPGLGPAPRGGRRTSVRLPPIALPARRDPSIPFRLLRRPARDAGRGVDDGGPSTRLRPFCRPLRDEPSGGGCALHRRPPRHDRCLLRLLRLLFLRDRRDHRIGSPPRPWRPPGRRRDSSPRSLGSRYSP